MDASKLEGENEKLRKQLDELHAKHEATLAEFASTLEDERRKVSYLERRIADLLRQIRGSRQERINPDQLMLFSVEELEELAAELQDQQREQEQQQNSAEDKTKGSDSDGDQPRQPRRRPLPKNVPTERRRYELDDEQRKCPCCGKLRVECGVRSSEQLEFIPAQWKRIVHERVQYACSVCQENVVIAAKPPQPIEKGLPAPGLATHTTLSKFGDHQPLYRLEDMHSRYGYLIRRSTLCGWLFALAELSKPLVMRMKHLVLQSSVIHTDDTKIKMLVPGAGIAQEAKFWPYLGDWLHPYAVYDFTIDRKRAGPLNFLEGFSGYLQADAYTGYDSVYAPGNVLEVACWVHARRYWYKARDYDAKRANVALGFITRLFQIEAQIRNSFVRNLSPNERDYEAIAGARQRHALPILMEFKTWLDQQKDSGRILPKSELRSAIVYTLNQWEALCRYIEQGYLSMDNNAAERLCKNSAPSCAA